MNPPKQLSTQASNDKGQVNSHQVWNQLTPTQQQVVFQTLVMICQHLIQQVSQPEVQNEDE